MTQRHMLLSALFLSSLAPIIAMDKWNPSSVGDNNNITRATNSMLGLIYRYDFTLNNDHTNAERALFNNSKLIRKKYGVSYEDVIASKKKLNLPHAIMILIRAPYPIQDTILQQLDIDLFDNTEQEAFSTPLAHLLITRKNLELRYLSPCTLRLLDDKEFACIQDVTIRRPRHHENYLNEDTQEFAFCTPISSAQKEMLSSLPNQFMQDSRVQWLFLSGCGEKPSALTTYIHAPLSMMLHAPRITYPTHSRLKFSPLHSRLTLATLLMIASTPRSHSFLSSYFLSCGTQIALPGLLKTYTDNQKCVIRNTRQFLQKDAAIFGASTCFTMVLHKIGLQMPLTNTIASIALAMAPFMLYDYYKYGLLYPIKTQTLAQLIQDHKKTMQIKKASFCTLL